jgi:3-methyladenine DNA glycosylase AlkD
VLATKLADPATMTAKELEAWLSDAANYVIVDAIAELAARLPGARSLGLRWSQSNDEWRAAAGWIVVASLALAGGLDDTIALQLLQRIEKNIGRAFNRTRHSMNGALIAIGGSLVGVRARALEVAESIGKVDVDHGHTNCTTPEAAPYIRKMLAHAERRQARPAAAPAAPRRSSRKPSE